MDKIISSFTFFFTHLETILICLVSVLGALGVIVEAVKKALPTKTNSSALESVGKFLVKAGEVVTKIISFIPSNLKKPKVALPQEENKK